MYRYINKYYQITFIVNKRVEMQYLGAVSKMIEWSGFIPRANNSVSQ